MIKYLGIILMFLFSINQAYGAGLKKLMLLDFKNIDKNPDFDYLEASITDTTIKILKEKFAFIEMKKEKWEEVALDNHIFLDDVHNRSVAMTLGLLSKQDIVISGGFRIIKTNKNTETTSVISVKIVLLDISKKTIISEFSSDVPVDNRIFDSIDKLAGLIAEKAKVVLPNKDEWSGKSLEEENPIFDNYIIGTRAGGGVFFLGLAGKIKFNQPVLSFLFQAHLPKLWDKSFIEINTTYFTYSPEINKNPAINRLEINATNLGLGVHFGFDYRIDRSFIFSPKLGGSYNMQSIAVTGEINNNIIFGIPYGSIILDFSYLANKFIDVILSLKFDALLEKSNITILSTLLIGVNFKL